MCFSFTFQRSRLVYEHFGICPPLLECALCLTSGVGEGAHVARAPPAKLLELVRELYREARQEPGGQAQDAIFATGHRILGELLKKGA